MPINVNAFLNQSLTSFGSLFQPADRRRPAHRWEIGVLAALILLGAVVRFWGMGSYGLHKPDEDTTVLPAVHILQDGTPRFPSGMFYARAITHSYLIAGSIKVFGENEWAMRLPSALCGLLVVGLAFFLGRRFLTPVWNLAFVACIALLPGMIADSQEARMYIFLLAGITVFALCVLRWERTGRDRDLVYAILAMSVAIQFHTLAIASALLVTFPGLLYGDRRRFIRGVLAMAAIVGIYLAISDITESFYPRIPVDKSIAAPVLGTGPLNVPVSFFVLPAILIGIVGVFAAWRSVAGVVRGWPRMTVLALTVAGFACQAALLYHLAVLLLLAAIVLGQRHAARTRQIGIIAAVCASLAVVQIVLLKKLGAGSLYKIAGILMGWPSIWTYLATAKYSPLAGLLLVVGMAAAFWQLSHHRRVPDYWLFFLLGAWMPLFALGFVGWYFPPRYTEFALLPMVLCAVAVAQAMFVGPMRSSEHAPVRRAAVVAAAVVAIAFINPFALARSVNAGDRFPDHRGAAQFVRTLTLQPNDIVMAEEVLMQTYYLGHVDYWLYGAHVAAQFVERINGEGFDQYTHTRVISSAEDLQRVIDKPGRGTIYIIGSGELQEDGRDYIRGPDLAAFFKSPVPKQIFVARDGLTKVWRIDPPAPTR